jgi:mercuric ion transport protein
MRSPRQWLTGGAAVGGLAGAVTAAIAGLCCAGPVTILLLGASGAVAAAGLAPFRLPLLLVSAVVLGFGYWRTYRPANGAACPTVVGRWIRISLRVAIVAWIVAATLWIMACSPKGPSSPYHVITADGQPLKSAFNANVGKVRVVMLVAPT